MDLQYETAESPTNTQTAVPDPWPANTLPNMLQETAELPNATQSAVPTPTADRST